MHIVQLLLPVYDNDGRFFPDAQMAAIRKELVARFGGVTATRTPAEGVWAHRSEAVRDDIIMVEVMTDALDHNWWRTFREQLEKQLRQNAIIIRTHISERL